MNDRHFYLTLPSNSSRRYYGSQHPSDYKTRLDHDIRLDPELWEVGLAEISYPKSWENLPDCWFYISHPDVSLPENIQDTASMFTRRPFGGTRYLSARHLTTHLQEAVRDALPDAYRGKIKVRYETLSNRVKFEIHKDHSLWMQQPLASVLGLSSSMATITTDDGSAEGLPGLLLPNINTWNPEAPKHNITAPYTINVNRLIPSIFVYCDIVQQQLVGDAFVSLFTSFNGS